MPWTEFSDHSRGSRHPDERQKQLKIRTSTGRSSIAGVIAIPACFARWRTVYPDLFAHACDFRNKMWTKKGRWCCLWLILRWKQSILFVIYIFIISKQHIVRPSTNDSYFHLGGEKQKLLLDVSLARQFESSVQTESHAVCSLVEKRLNCQTLPYSSYNTIRLMEMEQILYKYRYLIRLHFTKLWESGSLHVDSV